MMLQMDFFMSIPAIPQYNGTRVVCRAQIDGFPYENTPVATLIIIMD